MAQSQGGHEELMRLPRAHLMWTGGMCGMQRAGRAIPDVGNLGSCGWPPEQLTLTALEVQRTANDFSFFLKLKSQTKGDLKPFSAKNVYNLSCLLSSGFRGNLSTWY